MKKFQRTIEDFVCENCGAHNEGDGYTNHCRVCLWSKHVDVNPGDRAAVCGGLMKPVRLEGSTPAYFIVHECVRCGKIMRNEARKTDSREALLNIAKDFAEGKVPKTSK
ncbi:MAG: RNHCP domain-containing protein [bacterium]|nr:RNHCP domain-containing protein [bacterium]